MGGCLCGDDVDRSINTHMIANEKYEKTFNKLLFLGPGGSGKSTIFKQLQWLHGDGFSENDVEELRQHINGQIVGQMQSAIEHYLRADVSQTDEKLQEAIDNVKHYQPPDMATLSPDIAADITYIWQNDKRLNGIFLKHHKRKILEETTEYFWDSIDRIAQRDYLPTRKDILNIRNRTTGIIEKKFTISKCGFHIFDVGGQKSERKKWVKCFADVNAIVFVVALSSFDHMMFEDDNKNCMDDALELFDKTINMADFQRTPIILFLNKKDLFEKKIKEVPITACPIFDDYDGESPHSYEDCSRYIIEKFEEKNMQKRAIYTHLTVAVDDQNISSVFNDVVRIIIDKAMHRMAM